MSYDVAIVDPPIPAVDVEAWHELDLLIAQEGSASPSFQTLHDLLVARYPCLSMLSDDRVDEGVWSDGPLWNNFGPRAAVLGMVYSRVEEVLPFLIATATSLNFVVFDWQTSLIHRPDGFHGFDLTLENQSPLHGPTLQQLYAAVESLTPNGGPGFLVLDGPNSGYSQVAGGEGAFTVEWRESFGRQFRHWVAGISGISSKKEIAIRTNGFQVQVKENERLDVADVKSILTSFVNGERRPEKYAWRDITERFA